MENREPGRVTPREAVRRRSANGAEQDRLFFAPLGTRLEQLPWHSPELARSALQAPIQQRIQLAERELAEGWLINPAESLRRALRHVCRGVVMVHSGARERLPTWVIHDYRGQLSFDAGEILSERSRGHLGNVRRYALDGKDPFAERPVNMPTLFDSAEHAQELYKLLTDLGVANQLRVVLYDAQASLLGYVGMYLPEREAHTVEEHAALWSLVPALRRWLATARALGTAPLDDTGLTTALDVNEQPCYLVRDDGAVVFANRTARGVGLDRLELARARDAASPAIRLTLGGTALRLVTLRIPSPAGHPRIAALPTALRRVAEGLARGLSDKEIAQELQCPLSTVRTYTQRAMARLAVSSRRELMQLP